MPNQEGITLPEWLPVVFTWGAWLVPLAAALAPGRPRQRVERAAIALAGIVLLTLIYAIATILLGARAARLKAIEHAEGGRHPRGTSGGRLTTTTYSGSNRELNVQYASGAFSTYAYSGDGLRRALQDTGAPFTFTVWDGSDYLQERS